MTPRRKDTRKRGASSRLVRIDNETIALLDQLRRSSRFRIAGYGYLVRELAVRELRRRGLLDGDRPVTGLPASPNRPSAAVGLPTRQTGSQAAGTSADGGTEPHGEPSREGAA